MTTTTAQLSSANDCPADSDAKRELVVGFDGSFASIAALNSADALASKLGWSVHVVSILQPMSAYVSVPTGESASEIEDLRVQLRDAAVRHIERDPRRSEWTREVAVGEPAIEIVSIAREREAELIILGRADHESIGARRGGSIAADVIDGSPIPVLLVEADLETASTAVVAMDFRLASIGAAAMAISLLGDRGTLYMAHVDERSATSRVGQQRHGENYPGETAVLFRRVLQQLKPPPGIVVQTTILTGQPASAIIEFAECVHADFVALGRRSLSPPARALLGSVTENVVKAARFPLVIAPADTVTYGGAFA